MTGAEPIAQPLPVLDRPEVRITFFEGTGDDIVVAIGSRHPTLPDDGLVAQRLYGHVGTHGASVIAVEDVEWSYLTGPGVRDAVIDCVQGLVAARPGARLFGYGNSGGATNVLDLCGALGLRAALVVGPQIDVGPAFRAFDARHDDWMGWVPAGRPLPDPRAAFRSDTRLVILHGLRGPDAAHAALVPPSDRVIRVLFPDMAHDLPARMRPHRRVARMMAALRRDDLDGVRQIALEAGAVLPDSPAPLAEDPTWKPRVAPGLHPNHDDHPQRTMFRAPQETPDDQL